MNTAHHDPLIGRVLDERYQVRSRIARGGMATVYLAQDTRLDRDVALKIMHGHLAEDAAFKKRFDQEARQSARLAHPHVVNVFDQGQDAGVAYLVMEYLPGITLRDLLKTKGALLPEQTFEIAEAVLSGLAAAHQQGIVHRDMKPENILLADDGRIKLGDFGLARAASANTTTGQALLGTIAYLAPELVTKGIADERSDVYSFGIVLYEMITGVQPFRGEQAMQIAYQHANDEVPAPSLVSVHSTTELDALVKWATMRDAAARPADAQELLEQVREARRGGVITAGNAHTRLLATPLEETTALAVADAEPFGFGHPEPDSDATRFFGGAQPMAHLAPPRPAAPQSGSTVTTAVQVSRQRTKRGRALFLIFTLLILLSGGAGWWFGSGPGSLVQLRDVLGMQTADAVGRLTDQALTVTVSQCTSLTVPAGSIVSSDPAPGTRVPRNSAVQLCESTGPRMVEVPQLVGSSVDAVAAQLQQLGLVFAGVLERRFDSEVPANVVIAAFDEAGNELPAQLAEQSAVQVVASAGPLPSVVGLPRDEAIAELTGAGLVVDPAGNTEVYSTQVAAGAVISVEGVKEPTRVGDALTLTVSLGPELFEIPKTVGMSISQAMQTLTAAGFTPQTQVPQQVAGVSLWDQAKVVGTTPAAGERVEAGTSILVKSAE